MYEQDSGSLLPNAFHAIKYPKQARPVTKNPFLQPATAFEAAAAAGFAVYSAINVTNRGTPIDAIDMAISPYAMADPRSLGGSHFDRRTVCAGNIGPNKKPCMVRSEKAKPSGKISEESGDLEFE